MTVECLIQLRDYKLLKKKLFSMETISENFVGRIKILQRTGINLLRKHEEKEISLTVNIV
jgi:hypothetical protein